MLKFSGFLGPLKVYDHFRTMLLFAAVVAITIIIVISTRSRALLD